jgi:hypothetical protein
MTAQGCRREQGQRYRRTPNRAGNSANYDNGIEQAYARTATPPQTPVPIAATSDLVAFDRRFQVPLYFLHGRLCGPERPITPSFWTTALRSISDS